MLWRLTLALPNICADLISTSTFKNLFGSQRKLGIFLYCRLQINPSVASLYAQLIDQWSTLRSKEQAVFVEAIEQMIVNQEISSTCLQTLKESIAKLSVHEECSKVHALLFVGMKFLSLYSR